MEVQGKLIAPEKVAIYIRWSTEEQSDGTTLAEQREGCEYYIRSQGWNVNPALLFIDDGYSGGTLDRPAMRQLRALVQEGAVDCAVVLKIDRLSRNIVDATQLVLREWHGKCHLRCVRQPIDTTSETGRMFFAILATFADFERAQITERTSQGRIRRIREGKAYGGRRIAYGLLATTEPGVRTADPERAPIVAELFRRVREERATPRELQTWLAENRIASPEGDTWSLNSIRRLLRNEIYAGRIIYGKRREQPLVEVDAVTVPAIVAPEVFDEVQAVLAERSAFHRQHRRASDGTHLLTGVARCRCGAPVNIHWSRGRRYYRCSRSISGGPGGCKADSGTLPAEPVDGALRQDLLRTFGMIGARADSVRLLSAQGPERARALEKERGRRTLELERLERRIVEFGGLAGSGELSLPEWRSLTQAAQARREEVRRALAEVMAQLDGLADGVTRDRRVAARTDKLDRWADLTPVEQKAFLRELAESIELYKPKGQRARYEMRVVWRFAATQSGAQAGTAISPDEIT